MFEGPLPTTQTAIPGLVTDRWYYGEELWSAEDVPFIKTLLEVDQLAEKRLDQRKIPDFVKDLHIAPIETGHGIRLVDRNDSAYYDPGTFVKVDGRSTLALLAPDREIIAVTGSNVVDGLAVVIQIQGAITQGVDFPSGLTYEEAYKILGGFDWRHTLFNAMRIVADQYGYVTALLPNGLNIYRNKLKRSTRGPIRLCYDGLAEKMGFVIDPKTGLFVPPEPDYAAATDEVNLLREEAGATVELS